MARGQAALTPSRETDGSFGKMISDVDLLKKKCPPERTMTQTEMITQRILGIPDHEILSTSRNFTVIQYF